MLISCSCQPVIPVCLTQLLSRVTRATRASTMPFALSAPVWHHAHMNARAELGAFHAQQENSQTEERKRKRRYIEWKTTMILKLGSTNATCWRVLLLSFFSKWTERKRRKTIGIRRSEKEERRRRGQQKQRIMLPASIESPFDYNCADNSSSTRSWQDLKQEFIRILSSFPHCKKKA